MSRAPRSEYSTGILLACVAYGLWGAFPLYFALLQPAGALEILGHRMTWTLLFLVLLVSVRKLWKSLGTWIRQPRAMGLLAIAALAVSVNWGVYIWAVNSGHVIEGSLGYFINPLVVVLIGVVILGERLRRLQWVAVGLGVLAVAELTYAFGRPPWIALVLAVSFSIYGFVKKLAGVPAVEALTIETGYLVPFSATFLIWLELTGQAAFGHVSAGNTILLAMAGVITAVPLLAFGGAINRAPLSTVGLLQYITPVLQFLLGVFVFHEEMSPARWIGFTIVWLALVVMSVDAIRTARDPNWIEGVSHHDVAERPVLSQDVRPTT